MTSRALCPRPPLCFAGITLGCRLPDRRPEDFRDVATLNLPYTLLSMIAEAPAPLSASERFGLKIKAIRRELRDEYLQPHDQPWIIGFSGGKDSTLLLHFVLEAIRDVAPDDRRRPVYIVSNNTLVESPVF